MNANRNLNKVGTVMFGAAAGRVSGFNQKNGKNDSICMCQDNLCIQTHSFIARYKIRADIKSGLDS